MSSLTDFQPKLTVGHLRYHVDSEKTIDGYFKCDGSIVSRESYLELFNEIGAFKNSDGTIGTLRTSGTSNNINASTHGNNTFVYAGDNGTLATSSNGITWTQRTSGTSTNINALTYGDDTFVYAGNGGVLATSSDGITWTQRTSGISNNINSLVYANNTFVYAGSGGVLATSNDAITWTQRTSETSNNINALTYGDGTFVYAGSGGVLATSNDAITWTQRTSGTSNNINALTYGNNTFVYFGNDNLATSSDAITWTQRNSTLTSASLIYVGGRTFARTGNTSSLTLSLTNLTGGVSSAPAEGDVVFIAVSTAATTSFSQAVSGYTEIASLYSNGSNDTNLWVGYRIMSSPPSTTVTIPSTILNGRGQTVAIQVWRNTIPGVIFDVTATTSIINNSVIPNPPAITTISDDSILLVVGAAAHGQGSDTFGASYLNNFLTIGVNDNIDSTIGFGSILVPNAGTYDPAAWTFSGADSTNYSNASVTIALKNRKIKALTYGEFTKNFFLGSVSGTIRYSEDGILWLPITSSTSNSINSLTDVNNFVYVGDNGTLGTSSFFTYNPLTEFLLPTSNNIFNETTAFFKPTSFIKYE